MLIDGIGQSLPACGFGFELRAAFTSEPIKLPLTPGLGLLPIRGEKAAVLQPVQGRVE